jgi:CHASE2 domain-containing sensor protein
MHWTNSRRMRSRGRRIGVAMAMAALIAVGLSALRAGNSPVPALAILATLALVFFVIRAVRLQDR